MSLAFGVLKMERFSANCALKYKNPSWSNTTEQEGFVNTWRTSGGRHRWWWTSVLRSPGCRPSWDQQRRNSWNWSLDPLEIKLGSVRPLLCLCQSLFTYTGHWPLLLIFNDDETFPRWSKQTYYTYYLLIYCRAMITGTKSGWRFSCWKRKLKARKMGIEHIKFPPMRGEYLDRFGPMRVEDWCTCTGRCWEVCCSDCCPGQQNTPHPARSGCAGRLLQHSGVVRGLLPRHPYIHNSIGFWSFLLLFI